MPEQLTPEELADLRREANYEWAEFRAPTVDALLDHIEARELAFKEALQELMTPEGEIHPDPAAFRAYEIRMRVNRSVEYAATKLNITLH